MTDQTNPESGVDPTKLLGFRQLKTIVGDTAPLHVDRAFNKIGEPPPGNSAGSPSISDAVALDRAFNKIGEPPPVASAARRLSTAAVSLDRALNICAEQGMGLDPDGER